MRTASTPATITDKKPNILFIMADQLAGPALPAYGHPLVTTPHLSALAEGGVVFAPIVTARFARPRALRC